MTEILPWFSKAKLYTQTQCINKTQINTRVQLIGLGYHQSSPPKSPQMVLEMHWVLSLFARLKVVAAIQNLLSSSRSLKPRLCCVASHLLQLWGKTVHPQLSQCLQCSGHNKLAKPYMVGVQGAPSGPRNNDHKLSQLHMELHKFMD